MSGSHSTYFINTNINDNFSISCSHTKTSIYVYGKLICGKRPFYNIPIHKLAALCLIAWRDGNDSSSNFCLAIAGRRIVCGVGLGVLSLIGLVDIVIRIALSILTSPFPQINPKSFY